MAEAKITTADESAKGKYDFTNLNTLAVVSLATAVTGFGAAAAVITGHVSLAQIKKSNQAGRGLAIAGVAVGYSVIGIWIFSTIALVAFSIWGARHGIPVGCYNDYLRGGYCGGDHGIYPLQPEPMPEPGSMGGSPNQR